MIQEGTEAPLDTSIWKVEGRMTFFVQSNGINQPQLLSELIKQEYEVYLINDAANAKRIFYQYPDCLVLLNVDARLPEGNWFRIVQEVQQDPLLTKVRMVILTNSPDRLLEDYLTNLPAPCEFVPLCPRMKDNVRRIARVLDSNETKGRRRFLRIRCEGNARLGFRDSNDFIDGHILDLSSVAMTCILYPDKRWAKGSSFLSLQLELEGIRCVVSGSVMNNRRLEGGKGTIYVILFDEKTGKSSLDKIRVYIRKMFQSAERDLCDRLLTVSNRSLRL